MTARQAALATGLGAEHVQLRACNDHITLPLHKTDMVAVSYAF